MIGLHISRVGETDGIWIRLEGALDAAAVDELIASLASPPAASLVVDVSTLQPVSDVMLATLAGKLRDAHVALAGLTRHQERLIAYLDPRSALALSA